MTKTEVKRAITEAIGRKQSIVLEYKGKEREGNPHLLGKLKTGNDALRFYQTDGVSSSGLKRDGSAEDFRLLLIEDVTSVTILREKFKKHKEYKASDEDFDLKKPYTRV